MYMEIEFTFVYVGNKVPELVHEQELTQDRGKFYDADIIGSLVTNARQDIDANSFSFDEDGFDGLA